MNLSKKLLLSLLLLLALAGVGHAGFYGGQTRPHNHTSTPGDGGRLSSLDVTSMTVSGYVAFSSFTKVTAYLTTDKAVPTATATQIQFGGERIDTLSEWDTTASSFTAKNAGFYAFHVQLLMVTSSSFARRVNVVKVSGGSESVLSWSDEPSPYGTSPNPLTASRLVQLAAGDVLIVRCIQTSGSTQNISGTEAGSYFSIWRVP